MDDNNNSHVTISESTLDSHFHYEYMHRSHTETHITAGFFGFKLVTMDDRFVRKTLSGEETLLNKETGV